MQNEKKDIEKILKTKKIKRYAIYVFIAAILILLIYLTHKFNVDISIILAIVSIILTIISIIPSIVSNVFSLQKLYIIRKIISPIQQIKELKIKLDEKNKQILELETSIKDKETTLQNFKNNTII